MKQQNDSQKPKVPLPATLSNAGLVNNEAQSANTLPLTPVEYPATIPAPRANSHTLSARGKSSTLTNKRKHVSKTRSESYFKDTSGDGSGTEDHSGDGSSSGESVSLDAIARGKRPRISAITTRSSTRTLAPNVGALNSPSPALLAVRPPAVSNANTRMPTDHAGTSSVGPATIATSTDSADLQPPSALADTMDVDDPSGGDGLRADSEAPSTTATETEGTKAEATPVATTQANVIRTELIIKPTLITNTPSITTTVTHPLASPNVIDVGKVPAFLLSHGKGNRKVDIFQYLNKVQDPHFRQILFHYINFEANDKSGVGGSFPTGNRPIEISQWTSRARPANLPDYTKGKRTFPMFVDSVFTWWASIQPPWRSFQRDVISREIQGGWGDLHAPHINGLLNVVILAFWWVRFLEEQNPKGSSIRTDYEFFANDVAWVLSHLST